jgi:DNA sulfur modification protein DndB
MSSSTISLHGQIGRCGHLEVFLGFAKARTLFACSFADVLDEDTGEGYQRPVNRAHSRSFKAYIHRPGSSTIPLTFNLRPNLAKYWVLSRSNNGGAILELDPMTPCMARVDCQHRISEMADSEISLAFMTYVGLEIRSEMALFTVINSKARGLNSSLTDYHESRLIEEAYRDAPHLWIARKLSEDSESPWYKSVRLGGENTSGLYRKTSLRMLQVTIKHALPYLGKAGVSDTSDQYTVIRAYWSAVKIVFPKEWTDHRHHLLTKGIGLYSMTYIMCDILQSLPSQYQDVDGFVHELSRLSGVVDWSSVGEFSNAGGKKGANEVYCHLKDRLK